ncbi:UNKNOWN [Stylonychia lemnae]|uniref:Uncharacterized protein n=1 Tax=Stylonychia lemnae TaxID=5949 RepID=A0A078AMR8_STYLE|nr:UNKNOWN [Stylonychia lemnae]|eukprot:CDW83449.1 UNKNOWN [Stylonychia lemnae]
MNKIPLIDVKSKMNMHHLSEKESQNSSAHNSRKPVETESEHISGSIDDSENSGIHNDSPLFSPTSLRRNDPFKSMTGFRPQESVQQNFFLEDITSQNNKNLKSQYYLQSNDNPFTNSSESQQSNNKASRGVISDQSKSRNGTSDFKNENSESQKRLQLTLKKMKTDIMDNKVVIEQDDE